MTLMQRRSFLAGLAALPGLPPTLGAALVTGLATGLAPQRAGAEPALSPADRAAAGLLADLSRLPVAQFRPDPAGQVPRIVWGNLAGAGALGFGAREVLGSWTRMVEGFALEQVVFGLQGGWAGTVGFGPQDVARFLCTTAEPERGAILTLHAGAGDGVGGTLSERGYDQAMLGTIPVFQRGAEDFAIDPARRDPKDPFGGLIGKSSRVIVAGDEVIQTAGWALLAGLAGTAGPQGHPDLAALTQALRAPGFGAAQLLQAVVLNDQQGLATGVTGLGLLPWGLGLLGDLSDGKTCHAAALFSYATEAEAEESATRLARTWPAARSSATQGALADRVPVREISVQRASDGRAVLIFRAQAPEGEGGNAAYRFLAQARMMRDLAPFAL